MILIVMGVSGSGKTTLALALAKLTGWQFAEGDEYHSTGNREKMASGIPLTDEDRSPWLASLHKLLLGWHERGEDGILTCSALKQAYRDTLVGDLPAEAYRFELYSQARGDSWTLHAGGRVSAGSGSAGTAVWPDSVEEIDVGNFYRQFAGRWLSYGQDFRTIRKLRRTEEGSAAEVSVPDAATPRGVVERLHRELLGGRDRW